MFMPEISLPVGSSEGSRRHPQTSAIPPDRPKGGPQIFSGTNSQAVLPVPRDNYANRAGGKATGSKPIEVLGDSL
jgi:hypothetical protein